MKKQAKPALSEILASLERLPGYFTIKETAEVLGVSTSSVYSYVATGKLPAAYFGDIIVVSEEDVKDFQSRKRASRNSIHSSRTRRNV